MECRRVFRVVCFKNNLVLSSFLRALSLWQRTLSGNIFQGRKMTKKSFSEKVISVVSHIKRGKTLTYREVAQRAGNEKAARAVGNILNKYYFNCRRGGKKIIPCHRVIRSDGKIGGYANGKIEKIRLLKKENRS